MHGDDEFSGDRLRQLCQLCQEWYQLGRDEQAEFCADLNREAWRNGRIAGWRDAGLVVAALALAVTVGAAIMVVV